MYKNKHFDRENHVWVALSLYEHPRRLSTSETLTIFDLGSSELEKMSSLKIRRDFLSLRRRHSRSGSTLPEYFRRRHSNEGVDAKFSSTLPKDFAGEVVFDWIFWSL